MTTTEEDLYALTEPTPSPARLQREEAADIVVVGGTTYSVDLLVRAMFDARGQRRTPYTDEEWEKAKQSPVLAGSIRRLRDELFASIEDGSFEED